jgi:hypothetical protein
MNRTPLAALAAALLLCACSKDGGRSSAAAADSIAEPAPAPAGMMRAPEVARQGVDSSNAAQQQRLDQINQLSEQAGGTPQP